MYEIAVLYDALGRIKGWTPNEVDDMELWQCAVALGVLDSDSEPAKSGKAHGRDLLRQRILADQGLGQQPEVRPVSLGQIKRMEAAMAPVTADGPAL